MAPTAAQNKTLAIQPVGKQREECQEIAGQTTYQNGVKRLEPYL